MPCGPCGPCGPMGPCGPVGPGGPGGPGTPVGVGVGVAAPTVIEQRPCCPSACPATSVAVNVTTKVPTWLSVGVHSNRLLTGLPLTGSGGVILAPSGRLTTFRMTVCVGSGCEDAAVNRRGTPTVALMLEPQPGEPGGLVKTGGGPRLGTSCRKKSTAVLLFGFPAASRSSIITWVEARVLSPGGPSVAPAVFH